MAQNKENDRITFDLPKPLSKELKKEAALKMTSLAQVIRVIIGSYYKK